MLAQILGTDDRSIVQTLFDYLFRRINKYQYRAAMPSRAEAKAVWSRVEASGYILLNCKLYLYARHVAKSQGKRVRARDFEIDSADVAVLNRVVLKVSTKKKVLSLEQFRKAEELILTSKEIDFDSHMGRFISAKMTFLCRSYGLTMSGIKAQLLDTALYALRKQYPFFHSELHMVNICKTAVHNCGQSLISYWTRDKRNALIREKDGTHSAVHVDLDLAANTVGVLDTKDDPYQHTLQALLDTRVSLKSKSKSFVEIALGQPDPGFSLFLGDANEEVVHTWSYPRYLAAARSYLGISEAQQAQLLGVLKSRVLS